MEKIILNGIQQKSTKANKPFWVVAYDVVNGAKNQQATIGEWDSQLAWFLENEVGVRGSVNVELKAKGQYVNIVNVDMSGTHEKGQVIEQTATVEMKEQPKNNEVQKSIEAQMMFKTLMEFADLQEETIEKSIKAFNFIKDKL